MKELTIAVYQMEITSAKKEENLQRVKNSITKNYRKELDLVVLPELFSTGFAYSHFSDLAEEIDSSQTLKFLAKIAEENDINIASSILVTNPKKNIFQNVGFILHPTKGIIYSYEKIHLWGNEKEYFQPGTDVSDPVTINGKAMVGLSICYDLRFPEIAKSLVIKGAEVLITVAAWPSARLHHFNLLAAARALENTSYHIAVNRLGFDTEPKVIHYKGSSRVIDPLGNVIAGAGHHEQMIIATLHPEVLESARSAIPVLKDRKMNSFL